MRIFYSPLPPSGLGSFQVRDDDRADELLLAVVVELDDDALLIEGKNGARTELGVFYLGVGGE